MGIWNSIKAQFIDVIEYTDESKDIIVKKYIRVKDDDEIKWGAKIIVREGQVAVFMKGGQFTDVIGAGTHTLSTTNLPVISKILAVPYALNSPIKADVYFVSVKQFINQNWGTKNPIIMKDREFDLVRVRGFGTYAFRVNDPKLFMQEVYGTRRKGTTKEITEYLTAFIIEAFSISVGEFNVPVIELSTKYRELSTKIQEKANEQAGTVGVEFSNVIIENISLPEKVEKMIDERSSIGVVRNNLQTYANFETIQAMRVSANQPNSMAGIGAGLTIGNEIAKNMKNNNGSVKIKCQECDTLNDENAKFCSNCGAKLFKTVKCKKCGLDINVGDKFCSNCGEKI